MPLHAQFVLRGPKVWGQGTGKIPAKMGSSENTPLACLTSSNGQALHQEHNLGGPGGWGGDPEFRPILAGKPGGPHGNALRASRAALTSVSAKKYYS